MTLKQKLAEKERLAQEKVRASGRAESVPPLAPLAVPAHMGLPSSGGVSEEGLPLESGSHAQLLAGDDEDELIPSMTEQDRRRMAREREMEADLAVASDLLGASSLNECALLFFQSLDSLELD